MQYIDFFGSKTMVRCNIFDSCVYYYKLIKHLEINIFLVLLLFYTYPLFVRNFLFVTLLFITVSPTL